MVWRRFYIPRAALLLLASTAPTLAHGHDDHGKAAMDLGASMTAISSSVPSAMASATASMTSAPVPNTAETYFTHSGFSPLMLAHVGIMTLAWFFILPIGILYSALRGLTR